MHLHGEWFFERPAFFLQQICNWLDLDDSDESITQMMRPEESPFACEGPEAAKYGNNKGFIENPELRIGPIKPESLDGPLEWGADARLQFSNNTRNAANQLGYR